MRVSAFMQHYQRSVLKRSEADLVSMLKSWEPEDVWLEFLQLNNTIAK